MKVDKRFTLNIPGARYEGGHYYNSDIRCRLYGTGLAFHLVMAQGKHREEIYFPAKEGSIFRNALRMARQFQAPLSYRKTQNKGE